MDKQATATTETQKLEPITADKARKMSDELVNRYDCGDMVDSECGNFIMRLIEQGIELGYRSVGFVYRQGEMQEDKERILRFIKSLGYQTRQVDGMRLEIAW